MSDFELFFQEGMRHIADLKAYDHILFVTALCAIYEFADWKRLLLLVTAFTLGHSLTLALATLNVVSFKSEIIEFLIPITIVCTCLFNILADHQGGRKTKPMGYRYAMAAFFGLIHGLGFSNYLKSLMGKDASIVWQLLAFNLGLEVGQLLIVAVILFVTTVLINVFRVKLRDWTLVLSGGAAGIALTLVAATWPW